MSLLPLYFIPRGTLLWRADNFRSDLGMKASIVYPRPYNKYFTLSQEETKAYVSRNKFQKGWKLTRDLQLLDLKDPLTREYLVSIADDATRKSLDIAFPIAANGKVSRASEEETATDDDRVLAFICKNRVLGADGFYSAKQSKSVNAMAFHSEVGLCNEALDDLILLEQEKVAVANAISRKRPRSALNHVPANGPPPQKKGMFNNVNLRRRARRTRRTRTTKS